MQVTVLKPFPYSTDGKTSITLAPGQTPDIRDEMIPGLKSEGYVDCPGVPASALSEERRRRLIERIVAAGRRELEAAADEALQDAAAALDAHEARQAEDRAFETKVVDAAPETSAPLAEPPPPAADQAPDAPASEDPPAEAEIAADEQELAAPARRQRRAPAE
jgi:hypothetical protein